MRPNEFLIVRRELSLNVQKQLLIGQMFVVLHNSFNVLRNARCAPRIGPGKGKRRPGTYRESLRSPDSATPPPVEKDIGDPVPKVHRRPPEGAAAPDDPPTGPLDSE